MRGAGVRERPRLVEGARGGASWLDGIGVTERARKRLPSHSISTPSARQRRTSALEIDLGRDEQARRAATDR